MIQISLFRVSSDSKYIDIIVECPEGYHFNSLFIKRYDGEGDYEGWKDCTNLLIGESNKEVLRIAIAAFGESTLFYSRFGVIWDGEEPQAEIEPRYAICSDINKVYANLLDSVLKLGSCTSLDDSLYFKYMTLYAHIEAMRLNRFEDAEKFYDIIKTLFAKCFASPRTQLKNSCNC